MKICFFYHQVFRHGGIQRVVATLLNELGKEHECWIVCTQPIENLSNPYLLNMERVKVVYLNINTTADDKNIITKIRRRIWGTGSWFLHKECKKKVIDFINEKQFDCVIGCMLDYNILLSSIKNQINCKVIGWEHNSFYSYVQYNGSSRLGSLFYNMRKKLNLIFIKKHLKKLDKFIVLTNTEQKVYTRLFEINSLVIPNPLCITTNTNISSIDNKTILTIGRLETIKGSDMLVEIITDFCSMNDDWTFKIIGEGPLKSNLIESLSERKLIDRVIFEDFKENIMDEYLLSSIYLCPSRYESFGLTVLESLAFGLPVISFNTSGPREIIEGYNCGKIIPNYNVSIFTKELVKLALDDKTRKMYSLNATARSKDFEIKEVAKQWNNILYQMS